MSNRNFTKCASKCDYIEFHKSQISKQSGKGLDIAVYRGVPYQRGYGFFSNFAKRYALPFLKYIGKQAFTAGKDIVADVSQGDTLKSAAKKAMKKRAASALRDVSDKIEQSGSGKKRRLNKNKSASSKRNSRSKKSVKVKKRRIRKSTKKIRNFDIFKP